MMHYLLILLIGYLLGCSNMAVYLVAAQNVDLRSGGSGNPGASNALILMGWRAGLLVGAHDIAKAVLAVLLCRLLFPAVPLAGALSGAACVVGHMFPFYMRFHGGKGFAAYLGMTLALNWRFALLLLLAVSLITLVTDYVVLGTMTTVISVPLYSAWSGSGTTALLLLPLSAIIIISTGITLCASVGGQRSGCAAPTAETTAKARRADRRARRRFRAVERSRHTKSIGKRERVPFFRCFFRLLPRRRELIPHAGCSVPRTTRPPSYPVYRSSPTESVPSGRKGIPAPVRERWK